MKRKNLKIWCLLLTVAMLLTMLPVAAFAATEQEHLAAIEEAIKDTTPVVSMQKVNSESEAKSWLEKNWWKSLKKELADDLEGADISSSSVKFHLEDFEKAIPKNYKDEDGEYGSAIVVVTVKGKVLGHTTLLIEADTWGKAPKDDDDDDKEVTYGKDELAVQINWVGDKAANRPNSVLVKLYANGKLFRSSSLVGSKWYAGWKNIDNSKKWTVDVVVPDGYTCDIEEVSSEHFEVTMTKIGSSSSVSSSVSGSAPQKVNPETGAAFGVFCCR